jgi:hypothetical protein
MLLLILVFTGLYILLSLRGNHKEEGLEKYYKLENKQNILSKYKFCC